MAKSMLVLTSPMTVDDVRQWVDTLDKMQLMTSEVDVRLVRGTVDGESCVMLQGVFDTDDVVLP